MGKIHTIIFRVSEIEKDNLNQMLSKLGKNTAEFMRGLISDKYLKMFPEYTQVRKEKSEKDSVFESLEPYTPEKLCSIVGGEVVKDNGVLVCEVVRYNRVGTRTGSSSQPLSKEMLIRWIKDKYDLGELTLEQIRERMK